MCTQGRVPHDPCGGCAGLFINGASVPAASGTWIDVEDPATGNILTKVAGAGAEDVDAAVQAGKAAFDSGVWSCADPRQRAAVMNTAAAALAKRVPDIALLESLQVGASAPGPVCEGERVPGAVLWSLRVRLQTGRALREMNAQLGRLPEWFEYFAALIRVEEGRVTPFKGPYLNYLRSVPLGVVGQITPWNHPLVSGPAHTGTRAGADRVRPPSRS